MRKIIISAFVVLLIVLAYLMAVNGFSFFGMKILSIYEIKNDNDELNTQMEKVQDLATKDYEKAKKELANSQTNLLKKKEEYTDLVAYSSSDDIDTASKLQKYEMEYLWGKFGGYATKNGIKLKLVLSTGSATGQYNITFIATGSYVGVTEFISAIENDTSFAFKIENFKLIPQKGTEVLEATFMIKDVAINNVNINRTSTSSNANNTTTQNKQDQDTNQTTPTTDNTTQQNGSE